MNRLTGDDLRWLLASHEAPCVSLTMRTHRRPPEAEEDPVRYRRLLDQATSALRQRGGLTARELHDLLAPLEELTTPDFWVGQLDGLAVYRSRDGVAVFRLPTPVEDQVVIGSTFYVLPLLPLVSSDTRFFVLAISQGAVTLYQGDRSGLSALDIPELPLNIQDAVGSIQITNPPPFYSHHGGRDPMYTGTAGGLNDNEPDEDRYFRLVDQIICQRLKDEAAPLVLAAPAEEWDLYRQANHYPHLLEAALTGNYEHVAPETLHRLAWPLVAPRFDERQRLLRNQYGQMASVGRATDNLDAIALAATQGRILALLVAQGCRLMGTYDRDTGQVTVPSALDDASGQEDVLNALALQTLRCNGEVYLMPLAEMPVDAPVVAIFRY